MAKKAYTDKNLVLINIHSQKVAYLSATTAGKVHAKKQADQAAIVYPYAATLGKDTGFQGYEPEAIITWQPKQTPKGQSLTAADKQVNACQCFMVIGTYHG